ncbi:hypothetical protein IV203_028563 [Nitzschia inconspicua]|uniref:Uncharacterized protein n=1 Tax=Nitzschia inconspicua TaxID=303405 RepID=A0A9K3PZT8_9STRA|nr:hypothetical protein IV203_028563 [Nitzschia inconspicua]
MTAADNMTARNENVLVASPSSFIPPSTTKKLLEELTHRFPTVDKRPSFHFPPSVLAFFQEEYGAELNVSPVITPSTTFADDDDDSHESFEKRQPDFQHVQHFMVDEDDQRDVEQRQWLPPSDVTFGRTCHDEESMLEASMRACIDLLSSHDLDLNRVGLQRLSLLTKGRNLFGLNRSETLVVSMSLVYGGQVGGRLEKELQHAFSNMICDSPNDDTDVYQRIQPVTEAFDGDDDIIDFDILDRIADGQWNQEDVEWNDCNSSVEEANPSMESHTDVPRGKACGALHLHGLKILCNALIEVTNACLYGRDVRNQSAAFVSNRKTLHLNDRIWRNMMQSLVHNIETNHTANITGYSLKILRLLHAIHPDMIQPLLQQTLFPYLIHLQTYGQDHVFPMIHSESTYLVRRAKYLW